MSLNQIGVIGMAVMGRNIALNMADNGYSVAIYNRTYEVTQAVCEQFPQLSGYQTLTEFVQHLQKPRRILIMVKAGMAVDSIIDQLIPLLDEQDIIMDGGNSLYTDTILREKKVAQHNLRYLGVGISGGEEGARKGPAMFPGGLRSSYDEVAPIFKAISAKYEDGTPCVSYIGENGAGHYVKMVHNGIEYGDMQLIAESYDLLKQLGGFTNEELSEIYDRYNNGVLKSYLIEITRDVLKAKDDLAEGYLVDKILDSAGQKGTGKWTIEASLDLGQVTSVMSAAVYNRFLSSQKLERIKASKIYPEITKSLVKDKEHLINLVEQSLYFAKIMSYAQGFSLMKQAASYFDWNLNFKEIAYDFRAGCIIRAAFLNDIASAYEKDAKLDNLLLDGFFIAAVQKSVSAIREVVGLAVKEGISVAGFSNALAYFDGYRSENNPANLIQAQRDYFGAHTYQRKDREGVFHYDWFE